MSKQLNTATHYAKFFKAWPVKQVGRKPTEAELATVHAFARPGKQALALALMLRESGVTGAQIVMACGAPQLNKMRDTVAKGLAKRLPAPMTAEGHTVYRLALTAKGTAKVAKANEPAQADKPAKAKAVKPAKVKVQPANVVPQGEPVAT